MDWILCSDDLPEEDGCYLVMWRNKGYKRFFYEIQEYSCGEWCINIPQAISEVEIIAWQELPSMLQEV